MKDWFKARNIWGAAILSLSDEEAGRLAKALWSYTMTGNLTEIEGAGKGIFAMMMMTLGQDEERDQEISEKRSMATAGIRNQKASNAVKNNQVISNDIKCDQVISNDDNKNKNKSKNKSKEQEEYFEQFWTAYPRKVGKANARKAFAKINPNADMMQIILREIERQSKSAQWTKDGGQFIPYPATWLNGERWEDDVKDFSPVVKKLPAQDYEQRDYSGESEASIERLMAWQAKREEGRA